MEGSESGSILASRSAAPGSILGDFLKFDVAEKYEQRTLLREWTVKLVDRTHLVLVSVKLVVQKRLKLNISI